MKSLKKIIIIFHSGSTQGKVKNSNIMFVVSTKNVDDPTGKKKPI